MAKRSPWRARLTDLLPLFRDLENDLARDRAVARLVEVDSLELERVVDHEHALRSDLPALEKGQIGPVELGHAAVVEFDVEVVALHVEAEFHDPLAAPQLDVIGRSAFGDVHIPVKTENGPDDGAEDNDQHAGVDDVDPEIGPGPLVAREPGCLIGAFSLHAAEGFFQDLLHPGRLVLHGAFGRKNLPGGQFLVETGAVRLGLSPVESKGSRQAVQGADDKVDREKRHQQEKPR